LARRSPSSTEPIARENRAGSRGTPNRRDASSELRASAALVSTFSLYAPPPRIASTWPRVRDATDGNRPSAGFIRDGGTKPHWPDAAVALRARSAVTEQSPVPGTPSQRRPANADPMIESTHRTLSLFAHRSPSWLPTPRRIGEAMAPSPPPAGGMPRMKGVKPRAPSWIRDLALAPRAFARSLPFVSRAFAVPAQRPTFLELNGQEGVPTASLPLAPAAARLGERDLAPPPPSAFVVRRVEGPSVERLPLLRNVSKATDPAGIMAALSKKLEAALDRRVLERVETAVARELSPDSAYADKLGEQVRGRLYESLILEKERLGWV
jgi:hypothetical protein